MSTKTFLHAAITTLLTSSMSARRSIEFFVTFLLSAAIMGALWYAGSQRDNARLPATAAEIQTALANPCVKVMAESRFAAHVRGWPDDGGPFMTKADLAGFAASCRKGEESLAITQKQTLIAPPK